jgi:protein TonB
MNKLVFAVVMTIALLVQLTPVSFATPQPPQDGAALQQQPGRVRVGADVAQAQLVKKVNPVYPADARAARVQASVILQIVISTDGKVIDLVVLSGHPMLNQSAIDAVSQWEYSPFLLNGKPVEVVTTVTVTYSFQ